jgi:hypothetical protein
MLYFYFLPTVLSSAVAVILYFSGSVVYYQLKFVRVLKATFESNSLTS